MTSSLYRFFETVFKFYQFIIPAFAFKIDFWIFSLLAEQTVWLHHLFKKTIIVRNLDINMQGISILVEWYNFGLWTKLVLIIWKRTEWGRSEFDVSRICWMKFVWDISRFGCSTLISSSWTLCNTKAEEFC